MLDVHHVMICFDCLAGQEAQRVAKMAKRLDGGDCGRECFVLCTMLCGDS